MDLDADSRRPRVGLLLVHGIGEPPPGAFLGEFRDGFSRLPGAPRVADLVRHDPGEPSRRIHAAAIEFEDRTVMLYEVHWADLITPDMARASFDPFPLFLLAWFPWFNKRWKLPGFEAYSKRHVAGWTFRLVPLSVLFFFGYLGVTAVPHFWRAWDAGTVAGDRCRNRGVQRRGRGTGWRSRLDSFAQENEMERRRLWGKSKRRCDRTRLEQGVARTWFDDVLDRYAGDVTNFVASMARLPRARDDFALARQLRCNPPPDQSTTPLPEELVRALADAPHREGEVMMLADRARARFEGAAWVAAMQDECTEIQILGHSLGTLVAYHSMNRPPPEAPAAPPGDGREVRLTRFHTIGSPLEKIHFFWPRLVEPRSDRPTLVARGPGNRAAVIGAQPEFEWNNYYGVSDKVSGALRHFKGWGHIGNQRLAGLGGVLSAHVAYKENAGFLRTLAEQLGARQPPRTGGGLRAALAWVWSAWQALLLPLVVALVCLLGVGVFAAFSALAAGVVTPVIAALWHSAKWVFAGGWGGFWSDRLFLWLAGLFFAAVTFTVGVMVPAWARRAACVSVLRFWLEIEPGRQPTTAHEANEQAPGLDR